MKPGQSRSKGVRPNLISVSMGNYNVSTSPDLYIKFSVLCIKKRNYLCIGHFTTLSGHFFANYIDIFHKKEV